MSRSADRPAHRTRGPDDWELEPERRYAECQARLAEHCGVDVESRTVETDAVGRIHYLAAGDPGGKSVVLLHGVGTHAATWLPMLPALTDDYRVYVPDRPGRGLSAAPSYGGRDLRTFLVDYLVELFGDLGLDRPHVVGNSLGGQQAFLLAIDHDHVDRLCLVGAPGGLSREFPFVFRLLTMHGVSRLLFWLNGRGDPLENARESVGQFVVDTGEVPGAFYETLAAAQDLPGRAKSLRSLNLEQGSFGRMHPLFDISDEVVGIDRPTCFLWGTEDAFWPPEAGRPVAERMADATFEELPEHGHMPWLEPDEATGSGVRSFLDGSPE
jgi:pimeloyl-ACP methyl ester carboxylesterase